jgi:hypothetical protein
MSETIKPRFNADLPSYPRFGSALQRLMDRAMHALTGFDELRAVPTLPVAVRVSSQVPANRCGTNVEHIAVHRLRQRGARLWDAFFLPV